MKKVYHLKNCNTCHRILKELHWNGEFQEIRSQKITTNQLEEMAKMLERIKKLKS